MNGFEELKQSEKMLIPRVKKEHKKPKEENFSFLEVLVRGVGLLAAMAVPLSGVAPFGLAFMTSERKFSAQSMVSLLMVGLGYAALHRLTMLRYIFACIIYTGMLCFTDKKQEISVKTATAAAVVIMGLSDMAGMLMGGISVSGFLIMLFDLALTALGCLVFDGCRSLLKGRNIMTCMPSAEEKRSVCIVIGIALLGFQSISLPIELSAANVLGYIVLGVSAASGGLLGGVVFGTAIGMLLGLKGELLSYIAVFVLCGMVCGKAGKTGKYKTAAAFAAAGSFLTLYASAAGSSCFRFYEVLLAASALAAIPKNVFEGVRRFTDFGLLAVGGDNPYREHIRSRLEMTAASFGSLSETFVRLSDKRNCADIRDIAQMFDTAADRVCKNCERVNECWRRDFNATYKTMFKFLEIMERKGILTEQDADPRFIGRCLCSEALIKEINRLFEIYKINQVWKDKLYENRELAAEQFRGMETILRQMAEEIDAETSFDKLAAEEIRCRLADKSVETEYINVEIAGGRRSVRMRLKNGENQKLIPGVLKNVLGTPFVLSHFPFEDENGRVCLEYNEAPLLNITAGFSCAEKSEECGDAHMLDFLQGSKFLATISDGMGTGHKASLQSSAIVSLLENFMDAGFDKTVAVKLINSVMVMKSANEAFATVDMCMIDMYTGEAEFIKNGAEPSYIKRRGGTETVRAASLPVGVLSEVETESFAHRLCPGDTVVMVSDGMEVRGKNEGWLRKTIEDADPDMPVQELADYLMEKSVFLKGGKADDDMTVLAFRMTTV